MKLAISWLILAAAALAQLRAPAEPRRPGFHGSFIAPSSQPAAVIGSPFSADLEQRTLEVLADGTRIERRSPMSRRIFRDSQGRIREEQDLGGRMPDGQPPPGLIPTMLVHILDPVDGYYYFLDPVNKVAHRSKAPAGNPSLASFPPTMVQTFSLGQPRQASSRPGSEVEQLGTQMINGVSAEGVRIAMTVPAGQMGNDRPVQQVQESWYSADLKITVKRMDRNINGQISTTDLLNIQRSEPVYTLFQVPADFRIADETGRFEVSF